MAIKNAPDLTQRPPRSPRVRLGGFVILPRMLDKGRATVAGKHGEYHYACPIDQRFLDFVGVNADALKKQLAAGKGDTEILQWIQKNAKHKRTEPEILRLVGLPGTAGARGHRIARVLPRDRTAKIAPKREDIATWFDLLDLDDHVTFGGKA